MFLHFWKAHTWTKIEHIYVKEKNAYSKNRKAGQHKMVFSCLIHWATNKDGVANPLFPNETTNLAIPKHPGASTWSRPLDFPLKTTQKHAGNMPCRDVTIVSSKISKIHLFFDIFWKIPTLTIM